MTITNRDEYLAKFRAWAAEMEKQMLLPGDDLAIDVNIGIPVYSAADGKARRISSITVTSERNDGG